MRVFISAELSTLNSTENNLRTKAMKGIFESRGYHFVEVLGVYKGICENSFMVSIGDENLNEINNIGYNLFNQESIMTCDILANCNLIYKNGNIEPIGSLTAINPKDIELHENYSIINKVPYVCTFADYIGTSNIIE